ncbi:hypothetical protein CYR55_10330 [Chimaeribacter californicus]|uniref:Ibestrophin n=1 Tax=Chimaeribacter californicus TaxID=2060067 RepID=A0A2N5E771_9GAMM|nr:bestrophin family ion channel [Chimaeribacter californicus]PLR37328.1 hypothetical protein CYR55_10330 [Chimaeribacter californicus]
MIVRPAQHWFLRLFVWHGSVLASIMFRLFLNLVMSLAAVLCVQWYEALNIRLTLAPFSLLGIAIAIFLGFRNSVGYARFSEARQLWGGLMVAQRTLVRQLRSLLPQSLPAIREFAAMQIAYTWCLKHQLRGTSPEQDIRRLLPDDQAQRVLASPAPCNRLLLMMGGWLAARRAAGEISDMLYHGIDQTLTQLVVAQSGCERIHNTPIPFAYTVIVHRTVYLFCSLLPFALVPDLHYMTPLVSVFISYTFLSLDTLAEELGEPFGTESNDLPLNALCNAVEINLLEMCDVVPLPAWRRPDKHYLLD